jgi:3-methyl-2-oxobutanoate hydroxymethyltransferase
VDDIIYHTRPVARGAQRPLIVGDMPFMAYHVSVEDTIRNAGRIIKEGSADAVKMEGGKEIYEKVKTLVEVGIQVQAHIGLMPQKASVSDKFRVQGNTAETAAKIIKDALVLEEAGAFSVVLEFVTAEVAKIITEKLTIPTIGIGSGPYCDGQVLVLHDILGIYENLPPFAKKYADLYNTILDSLKKYHEEVRSGTYPDSEHTISMNQDELRKLESTINEY